MGALSDMFGFDSFALKDLWRGIKKNPERLLIGAADPWSTKAWNKVLGKDWEPLVDQMGGPYGGHTISAFGANDGGVYQRARDAGIDTGAGENAHDAAHVIAAMFAGNYGMGQLGAGGTPGNAGGAQDWTRFAQMQPPGQQQDPNAAQREAEERRRRQKEEEEQKRREQLAQALKRLTEQQYAL